MIDTGLVVMVVKEVEERRSHAPNTSDQGPGQEPERVPAPLDLSAV